MISTFTAAQGFADCGQSVTGPADVGAGAAVPSALVDEQVRAIRIHRQISAEIFRDPARTPLLAADFAEFDNLDYFPIDTCYIRAAEFHPTDASRSFELPTFDGGSQKFVELGSLSFRWLDGSSVALLLLQRAELGPFGEMTAIVPFRDQTNGSDTYSGGRYLKFLLPLSEPLLIDFNRAVNPACAYNPNLPCPIPPRGNWLSFPVPAGERSFVSVTP